MRDNVRDLAGGLEYKFLCFAATTDSVRGMFFIPLCHIIVEKYETKYNLASCDLLKC